MKVSISIELQDRHGRERDLKDLMDRIVIAAHGAILRARETYLPEVVEHCPAGMIFFRPLHDEANGSSAMVIIGEPSL